MFTKSIFTSIHRALAIIAKSDNYIYQISTGIESKIMIYLNSKILFSNEKEQSTITCYDMDQSHKKKKIEYKKPDTEKPILRFIYIKFHTQEKLVFSTNIRIVAILGQTVTGWEHGNFRADHVPVLDLSAGL